MGNNTGLFKYVYWIWKCFSNFKTIGSAVCMDISIIQQLTVKITLNMGYSKDGRKKKSFGEHIKSPFSEAQFIFG